MMEASLNQRSNRHCQQKKVDDVINSTSQISSAVDHENSSTPAEMPMDNPSNSDATEDCVNALKRKSVQSNDDEVCLDPSTSKNLSQESTDLGERTLPTSLPHESPLETISVANVRLPDDADALLYPQSISDIETSALDKLGSLVVDSDIESANVADHGADDTIFGGMCTNPSAPLAPSSHWAGTGEALDTGYDFDGTSATAASAQISPSDTSSQVSISEGPFYFECDSKSDARNSFDPGMTALTDSELEQYFNSEALISCSSLVSLFVQNHQLLDSGDLFYRLVSDLHVACSRAAVARRQHLRLSADVQRLQRSCWCLQQRSVEGSGICRDGHSVSTQMRYEYALYDALVMEELKKLLVSRRRHLADTLAPCAHTLQVARLKLQRHLGDVWHRCSGGISSPDQHSACCDELRHCCAVLFEFQRRCHTVVAEDDNDSLFIKLTRSWLLQLASVLIELDNGHQEHIYLLNEVLHCDSGMADWALPLVQLPLKNRPCDILEHYLVALQLILSPVMSRGDFLRRARSSHQLIPMNEADDEWVLVDDDEEFVSEKLERFEKLQEKDLLALFNKLSWNIVMRHLVGLPIAGGKSVLVYDVRLSNEFSMIRLFAYATHTCRLLVTGLSTYDDAGHNHLCRVICHTIVDIVHTVSDHWQCFHSQQNGGTVAASTLASRSRLLVEYDSFVCRTVALLVNSVYRGVWHFVTDLPFRLLSNRSAWRILWLLHSPTDDNVPNTAQGDLSTCQLSEAQWTAEIFSPSFQSQFHHQLVHMGQTQVYFRLSALTSMALARSSKERTFIKAVTRSLMQVCFVALATRELCSKAGRDMIASVCNTHAFVMSYIISLIHEHLRSLGRMALYLVSCLPLTCWRPTDTDIELVCSWLTEYSVESVESQLARKVLERLDWGLDRYGRQLCLSSHLHRRVALAVVVAQATHAPEQPLPVLTGEHAESVHSATSGSRHVLSSVVSAGISSLASVAGADSSHPTVVAQNWCWQQMSRLRLHALDTNDHLSRLVCQEPTLGLADVPSLSDRRLAALHEPLHRLHQPLAVYASLLITQLGHSVPQLCGTGLARLTALVSVGRSSVVNHLIQLVVPLFVGMHDRMPVAVFEPVLSALLTADQSYLKTVRTLVSGQQPGPLLQQLAGVIQSHVSDHRRYGLESPTPFVLLWLRCLTSLADWQNNTELVYVIDQLLRTAFCHSESRKSAFDHLYRLFYADKLTSAAAESSSGGGLMSLLSWMTSAANNALQSLFSAGSRPDVPWLAWFLLAAETHAQRRSGLWCDLIATLHEQQSVSLESALRSVCSQQRLPFTPAKCLSIYRWAQQALDTPLDCPLLVEFWRQFMALYLARVFDADDNDCGSVGCRFFDGLIGGQFWKKIQQRLRDAYDHYRGVVAAARAVSRADTFESASEAKQMADISRLLGAFCLWIDEPQLAAGNLSVHTLPAAFESTRLAGICVLNKEIQCDQELPDAVWSETMLAAQIRRLTDSCRRQWTDEMQQIRCSKTSPKIGDHDARSTISNRRKHYLSSSERISKRLNAAYIEISPAASTSHLLPIESTLPPLDHALFESCETALQFLNEPLERLRQHSCRLNTACDQLRDLDGHCTDQLLPVLYSNQPNQLVCRLTCDSSSVRRCSGAAVIAVECEKARLNDAINIHVEQNTRSAAENVCLLAEDPPLSVNVAAALLDTFVSDLLQRRQQQATVSQKIGAAVFYRLLGVISDEQLECRHIEQFLMTTIEVLGRCFIANTDAEGHGECAGLLAMIKRRVDLIHLLLPHFTPLSVVDDAKFVSLLEGSLEELVQSVCQRRIAADGVVTLLQRFSIGEWVRLGDGRECNHCSAIIRVLVSCLQLLGQLPLSNDAIRRTEAITSTGDKDTNRSWLQPLLEECSRNLFTLLRHNFQRHFGEVLLCLLDSAGDQKLSVQVLFDFANSIIDFNGEQLQNGRFHAGMGCSEWCSALKKVVGDRIPLSADHLTDICRSLTVRFVQERAAINAIGREGGLYSRYGDYALPLASLLHFLVSQAVLSTVRADGGSSSDLLLRQQLWPLVRDIFDPWTTPMPLPPADCRQSLLLPWTAECVAGAQLLFSAFMHTLSLLHQALPADPSLLCHVWQHYGSAFAYEAVPSHVFTVVHEQLLQLPWCGFYPRLSDIERMVGLLDLYLPDAHSFIAQIVVKMPWVQLVSSHTQQQQQEVSLSTIARLHSCILTVLVKVGSEPKIRQSGELFLLISRAEAFRWHLLDADGYQRALNWYVLSADPRCVLETEDREPVDLALNDILRVAAGFTTGVCADASAVVVEHMEGEEKRRLLMRAVIRLMCGAAFKHKQLVTRQPHGFTKTLLRLLCDMKSRADSGGVDEVAALLTEILGCCSSQAPVPLIALCNSCLVRWLETCNNGTAEIIVRNMLSVSGVVFHAAQPLAELLEAVLDWLFNSCRERRFSWQQAAEALQIASPMLSSVTDAAVSDCRFLVLHALLLRRYRRDSDDRTIGRKCRCEGADECPELAAAELCVDWLTRSTALAERHECAVCALLHRCLQLLVMCVGRHERRVAELIVQLSVKLLAWSDETSSGRLLAVIGLGRRSPLSPEFRVLCRVLCAALVTHVSTDLRVNTTPRLTTSDQQPPRWPVDKHSKDESRSYSKCGLPDGLVAEAYVALEQLMALRGRGDYAASLQLIEEAVADTVSAGSVFTACTQVFIDAVSSTGLSHGCLREMLHVGNSFPLN